MSPAQGTDEWPPIYSGVRWDITERRQYGVQSLYLNATLSPTRNVFAEPPDAACKTGRLWILRQDHGAGCAGELRLGIHRSSLPAHLHPHRPRGCLLENSPLPVTSGRSPVGCSVGEGGRVCGNHAPHPGLVQVFKVLLGAHPALRETHRSL